MGGARLGLYSHESKDRLPSRFFAHAKIERGCFVLHSRLRENGRMAGSLLAFEFVGLILAGVTEPIPCRHRGGKSAPIRRENHDARDLQTR